MISPEVPIHADAAIRLQGASERGTRSDGPSRLLFTTTYMGRTLHYELRGDRPIPIDAWSEIEIAQRYMNDRFTWTCENLGLERHDDGDLPEEFRRHGDRLGLRAWGFTKVADDEWNALLVVRFLTWVSRRLPAFMVTLHDEGDYVLAGYVLLRKGMPKLDHVGIDGWRDYLDEHRMTETLARLDDAIGQAERGTFFARVPAEEYADRPEFHEIDIPKDAMARLTLDDVAEMIVFPWDAKLAKAA